MRVVRNPSGNSSREWAQASRKKRRASAKFLPRRVGPLAAPAGFVYRTGTLSPRGCSPAGGRSGGIGRRAGFKIPLRPLKHKHLRTKAHKKALHRPIVRQPTPTWPK